MSTYFRHKSTKSVKSAMEKLVYEDMISFESDVRVMEMRNTGGSTDTEAGNTSSKGRIRK